jgi:gliding motility-associated-like protein
MKLKSIFSLVIISLCSSLGLAQSDNCATATIIDLSTGTACVNGTTIGATSANTMYGACNAAPNNEVWYTYVSNGASNSFSVTSNGITNAEIVVYTGGCSGQLELCNAVTGTATLNSSWGITAGTQVWIGVMSNGGTQGGFQLCVNSDQPTPTGGNACSGAIPICDVNDVLSLNMSTLSASGTYPSCFLASVNQDVWFTFTVTQSGTIQWAATPTGTVAGVELDWAMYNVTAGCPGTMVACNYNYSSAAGSSAGMSNASCIACPTSGFAGACAEYCTPANVVAGQTYAIMVDYFTGGSTGTMDFGFLPGTTALIAPVANFTINPTTYTCGASVNVAITNSSVGGPQNWDFGNGNTYVGTTPPNQTYSTPGVYAITETIGGSCPTYHTEFVELYAPLAGTVTSTDAQCSATCDGTATVTSVSGGDGVYTYLWSNAGETTNSVTGLCPGAYTVTISNALCGSNVVLPVNISQLGVLPNANAGGAQVLNCTNTTVQLNGSSSTSSVSFSWTGPGIVSGGATASPIVNQPGNYVLTVTDGGGACSSTANVYVTQDNAPPNANAGGAQLLNCTVTSVQLNGSSSTGGVTFSWSGPGIVSGGISATPIVNQPGTYALTVTNPTNGCTATANVNVTQNNTPPNANAGTAQVISCSSSSVQLNGSSSTGGVNFSWAGPGVVSGGSSETPMVNMAGAYTLTVTNPANGCTSTSNVNVTNDVGIPNVNTGGPQVITCTNPSAVLNGSSSTAGVTFSWAGPGIVSGGSTATPTVNADGVYTLTVNDASNGCSANANVNVTLNNTIPNANAGAAQILNCSVTSVQLNGSSTTAGVTFSWSGPGIVNGANTATPNVNQPGNYILTVTNPANGCMNTANVNVTQDITIPTVNFVADTLIGCDELLVNFQETSGQIGMDYQWNFGDQNTSNGGASVSNFYTQMGCFDVSITITNPVNGCSNSSSLPSLICVVPMPNAELVASPNNTTTSNTVVHFTNNSTGATSYTWDFGDNTNSGVINPVHTYSDDESGSYVVELIAYAALGCSDTAWVTIRIEEELIFYVPNTFTPDGDSYNEYFKPVFTSGFDPLDFTLLIFNRWGEIIWESHDALVGWDGIYGGSLVEDGSYTWKIEFKSSETDKRIMKTGHVSVIR